MRRRRPSTINQTISRPSELSQKIPGDTEIETGITNFANSKVPTHSVNNGNEGMTHTRPLIPDALFYPGPTYKPPPKPVRTYTSESYGDSQSSNNSEITNADPRINLDFEEKSPFQEGDISEAYQKPDKSFFQEPWELSSLIKLWLHCYLKLWLLLRRKQQLWPFWKSALIKL